MKRLSLLRVFATSVATILASLGHSQAQATTFTWDPTGLTGSETAPLGDGAGNWDNTTFNWDDSATPGVTTTIPAGDVTTMTETSGSSTITVTSPTGLAVGESVYGGGIAGGAYITAISGDTVTLSAVTTVTETNEAIVAGELVTFGHGGTGGAVNLTSPQAVYSVTVNTPGYTFSGSQLTVPGTIADTAASGVVEFDNNLSGGTGVQSYNGNNAFSATAVTGGTLYFNGGTMSSDNGYAFNNSATTGNINFNNETLNTTTGGKYFAINNGTSNFTGTTAYTSGGQLRLGASGNTTVNVGSTTNSTAVLNLGTFTGTGITATATNTSQFNVEVANYSSTANIYGTLNSNKVEIDDTVPTPSTTSTASSSGTLNVYTGAVVNDFNDIVVQLNGTASTTAIGTASGTLNIKGGTFNQASGAYALYVNEGNNTTGTSGTVNVSGGTLNVQGNYGIDFGSGNTTQGVNSAILNLTGGTLNIGSGGIHTGAYGSTGTYSATNTESNTQVNFGGGTVGALASWTSLMPITFTGTNGNTTFNTAATLSGTPGTTGYTITLGGLLSGTGGFTKTGLGTLAITGTANTYSGKTLISAGTLTLSSGGTSSVEAGAGTTFNFATSTAMAASASLTLDSLTTSFVTLNYTDAPTGVDTILSLTVAGQSSLSGIYTASQLDTMFNTTEFSGTGSLDILTVAPEPSTWALLFAGLGFLFLRARRRQGLNRL